MSTNNDEAQFTESIPVFSSSKEKADLYTVFKPKANERKVIFTYGGHACSFYWSMNPEQAIAMAAHLVELAESLREFDQVAA